MHVIHIFCIRLRSSWMLYSITPLPRVHFLYGPCPLRIIAFYYTTCPHSCFSFFFFNDPAPTEISPLPLHAPLPIWRRRRPAAKPCWPGCRRMPPSGCSAWQRRRLPARRTPSAIISGGALPMACARPGAGGVAKDRESTRLHSNHDQISYSGFFLEKK